MSPPVDPSSTPQPLDVHTLPLHGSRLIEASAGTGKTWTLSALVVRLVLGHGPGLGRALMPDQILVMTFTRAATRELVDRIRARLAQAAQALRADDEPPPGDHPEPLAPSADPDPFLARLRLELPPGDARRQAAHRLALAAEAMDEAAIFTLDAWCQRVLRQHVTDGDQAPDDALLADEQGLRLQAVQDYWRQQVYPLSPDQWAELQTACPALARVDRLAEDLSPLLERADALAHPPPDASAPLPRVLAQARRQRQATLAAWRTQWRGPALALRDWVTAQFDRHASEWNGRQFQSARVQGWVQALVDWAHADDPPASVSAPAGPLASPPPDWPDLKTGWDRLTPEGLAAARRPGAPPLVVPPEAHQLAALRHARDALAPLSAALRAHALHGVAQRLDALKRRSGRYGFHDLLTRLAHALDQPSSGERLRQRIRQQYPVALVDEFQDTSPLQYRLLDRIYRVDDHDPSTALLLIGDPKQSIYAFRGADIHSYLRARQATAGRHHVLDTNHRSTVAVVGALNHLFLQAERREGPGAFRYRLQPPAPAPNAADNPVPFWPVQARGRAETLRHQGRVVPAVTVHLDTDLLPADALRQRLAARAAEQLVAWLNGARGVDAAAGPPTGFASAQGPVVPLRPADVAVLVRTRTEARAMQRALQRRGVASVYLSDRESVFHSPQAADLVHWLTAVAQPQDVRLARAALATRLLARTGDELHALAHDDDALDAHLALLAQLHGVWRQRGVLALLRQTLHRLDLPARWLRQPDGERQLTNLLHLGELLQSASAHAEGEAALLRWLVARIATPRVEADDQVVRLESDADRVQIVTIHKSKGLEYPVVLLPFATALRPVDRRRLTAVREPAPDGTERLRLHVTDADLRQADEDRLREDVRLLYVALTRARHALWLGVGRIRAGRQAEDTDDCDTHRSALGSLLAGDQALDANGWRAAWARLCAQATPDNWHLQGDTDLPETLTPLRPALAQAPALRPPQPYLGRFERDWGVGSFSALVRDGASSLPLGLEGAVRHPALDETLPDVPDGSDASHVPTALDAQPVLPATNALSPVPPLPLPLPQASLPHRFPRGPLAGVFLHDQLEWLGQEGFDLSPDTEAGRANAARLLQRGQRAGHGHQADELLDWMRRILSHPLGPAGVSLAQVASPLPEMAFWLPVQGVSATAFGAQCHQHVLLPLWQRAAPHARADALRVPDLTQRPLNGLMMGFADLVFAHAGRYWVLDYKSNHLGPRADDYTPQALVADMARHRYDVQATLYTLALHRLLASRMGPAYVPAQHLGGALYLYLRGLDGPAGGVCHVPPSLELLAGWSPAHDPIG